MTLLDNFLTKGQGIQYKDFGEVKTHIPTFATYNVRKILIVIVISYKLFTNKII